jgi:NAD-dependent deacetylase
VIEINIEPSAYTSTITDLFLKDKATVAAERLEELLLQ